MTQTYPIRDQGVQPSCQPASPSSSAWRARVAIIQSAAKEGIKAATQFTLLLVFYGAPITLLALVVGSGLGFPVSFSAAAFSAAALSMIKLIGLSFIGGGVVYPALKGIGF